MHFEASFEAHPVLGEIEPALAGEQVTDLNQPQDAVVVALAVGQGGKAAQGMHDEHQRGGPDGNRHVASER